jgi:hypothetical protein
MFETLSAPELAVASMRALRGAQTLRSMRTWPRLSCLYSGILSAVVVIRTVPSGFGTSEMRRRSSPSSSGATFFDSIRSALPS